MFLLHSIQKWHTAARVWEAREAQPEELLAAISKLTARSEDSSATNVDVERLYTCDNTVRALRSPVSVAAY